MLISKSANFENWEKFLAFIKKLENKKTEQFNFSGNVAENGQKSFCVNWNEEEDL